MKNIFAPVQNNRGQIAFDFIFAILLVSGISTVLFFLTLTLSVMDIIQYLTFSAARVGIAAHTTETRQKSLATQKFSELAQLPAYRLVFSSGWFNVDPASGLGDYNSEFPSSSGGADDRFFYGFRAVVAIKALNITVSGIGSTNPENKPLTTKVTSYLLREPSDQECQSFNKDRYNAIQKIKEMPYAAGGDLNQYALITDNGC